MSPTLTYPFVPNTPCFQGVKKGCILNKWVNGQCSNGSTEPISCDCGSNEVDISEYTIHRIRQIWTDGLRFKLFKRVNSLIFLDFFK